MKEQLSDDIEDVIEPLGLLQTVKTNGFYSDVIIAGTDYAVKILG
jgi:hypothetical protein